MATFKKRTVPTAAKIRRNTDGGSGGGGDDDDDDGNNAADINLIKLGQQLKREKIKKGTEFSNGTVDVGKPKASAAAATGSSGSSSSATMLGSTAFESRIDTGLPGAPAIAHEKIMQQYIEEKLNKASASTAAPAPTSAEDELYRLPDEIKVMGKAGAAAAAAASSAAKAASDGADDASLMVAMSLGIMEVALPAPFRQQNLEATEAARRQVEAQREARYRQKHEGGGGDMAAHTSSSSSSASSASSSSSSSSSSAVMAVSAGSGTAPGYRGVPNTTLATNRFFRPPPPTAAAANASNPAAAASTGGGGGGGGGGNSSNNYSHNNNSSGNSGGGSGHLFNNNNNGGRQGAKRKTADDRVFEDYKKRILNAPRR